MKNEEERLHIFLELGIKSGDEWLASQTGLFISEGRDPQYPFHRRLCSPIADLDMVMKRKVSSL
jgi:hypothetical protein